MSAATPSNASSTPRPALAEAPTLVEAPSHGAAQALAPAPGAPLPADGPTAAPPVRTLAGRYAVLDWLGQGGMGMVLAAYDSRLDRRVALKLLRSHSHDSDGPARLVREAQAMARLSHPHVVSVYDSGTLEDGSVFIAMEYVQGQTLRRWCQQHPRPWREVLGAYLAAGRGLAGAAGLLLWSGALQRGPGCEALAHRLAGVWDAPVKALPPLERALRLAPPRDRPEVQFALAQALWEAGQERPRAVALATETQLLWQQRGASHQLAKVNPWLASRRLR